MEPLQIQVIEIAAHRNGVEGAPFVVVTFVSAARHMVAVVFREPFHVAVFDRERLGNGTIAFGENSWRGDQFELPLRAAIAGWEETSPVDR